MFISEGNHLVYMGTLEYYFQSETWFMGILVSYFFAADNMPLAINCHVNSQQCKKGLCTPSSASLLHIRFSLPSRLNPKQVFRGRRQQCARGGQLLYRMLQEVLVLVSAAPGDAAGAICMF